MKTLFWLLLSETANVQDVELNYVLTLLSSVPVIKLPKARCLVWVVPHFLFIVIVK